MTELTELKSWIWLDYDEVGSTNDEALRLSKNLTPKQKLVITAHRQTKGRGRRGRNWISLDGNLFMSQLFNWPQKESGAMPFIASLSVLNTILKISPHTHVELKWPNDVLLNNCKVSGILLERGEKDAIVIGIGVNIKYAPDSNSLLYPTTSLQSDGIDCSYTDFLKLYLDEFDNLLQLYTTKGMPVVVSQWLQHAKGIGFPITVHTAQNELHGVFKGVSSEGTLQLETLDGKVIDINAGDVFFDKNGEDKK